MDTADQPGQTYRFTRLVVDARDAVVACDGRNARVLRSLVEPAPHPLVHLLLAQARRGETVEITSYSGTEMLPSMLLLQAVPLDDGHVQLTTTRVSAAAAIAEAVVGPDVAPSPESQSKTPAHPCAWCPKEAWCAHRGIPSSGVATDGIDACLLDLFEI